MTQNGEAIPRHLSLITSGVLIGSAIGGVLLCLAMWAYPGGSFFDLHKPSYDFWLNTLSDLGRLQAVGGDPNQLSAWLFMGAMSAMVAAFSLLMYLLPILAPAAPGMARVAGVSGWLSAAGVLAVSLTPADVFPSGHLMSIAVVAAAGLLALLLFNVALWRSRNGGIRYQWLTRIFFLLAAVQVSQFVGHFVLQFPWTPREPFTQKLFAALGWSWTMASAIRIRRLLPERGA